ncbi:MAG: hypothetical protein ACI4PW_03840 [Alphaproteobacteria bacterium]
MLFRYRVQTDRVDAQNRGGTDRMALVGKDSAEGSEKAALTDEYEISPG